MLLLRRFLVIMALMFWQGGFLFYATVVVPVGTEVFGRYYQAPHGETVSGKRQQGRITRTVAFWINVAGAVALVPLAWDLFGGRRARRRRVLLFTLIAVLLATLGAMYVQLDSRFQRETLHLLDEPSFLLRHRIYLWTIAAQWGCCLLYMLLTLRAWREEDVAAGKLGNGNGPTFK